jgi:hypothetical protein
LYECGDTRPTTERAVGTVEHVVTVLNRGKE